MSKQERIRELEREIPDYERSAQDPKAWLHHRAYDAKKAAEMRTELKCLKGEQQ